MDFDFVTTSDNPQYTSQSNRQVVRRRATQAGARTRRREAHSTRVNLLQLPPWLVSHLTPAQVESINPSEFELNHLTQPLVRSLSASPPRSLLAIQELLEFSKQDMSKTLLSHERHSTILSEPLRIQKIIKLSSQQLFLGLGERHERNQCSNEAINCLWAYVQQFLFPESSMFSRDQSARYYVRALNNIRLAIDKRDPLNCMDVWYATLILILYESFNASDNSWIIHSCGAIHVLEHLGPQSIVSEYHKNLLTAQSALMITESIFQNKRCFLSQPEWQIVLQTTIVQDPVSCSRSELTVQLWMHAAHIPCIFHDITSFIVREGAANHEDLTLRTRTVCENYQTWYGRWQIQLESAVEAMSTLPISEVQRHQVEIFCCYLEQFCLINRLLLALHPLDGVRLEEAIAERARRLLEIYEQYVGIGQPRYRIGLSAFIAEAVSNTTDEWISSLSDSSTSLTVEPAIFTKWCEILRRKVG